MSTRDDDRSARQIARSQRRKAGDRSGSLARALMQLRAPAIKRLQVEDELRATIERAHAVSAPGARRRAERTLAGELRRYDLAQIATAVAKLDEASDADVQRMHLAERWRGRLLEEGVAAAAEFPGGGDDELPRLIDAARRERATGRPPGAARALFRHVMALLAAHTAPDESPDDDESA